MPTREALSWITWQGAAMLGMTDRIGSLAVGKQADPVMIDARALNLWPVHDAVATAMRASLANIRRADSGSAVTVSLAIIGRNK